MYMRLAQAKPNKRTNRFALVVHILFDGRCFPDLVIILGNIQVGTLLQSMLDHQVVVFEFEILVCVSEILVLE